MALYYIEPSPANLCLGSNDDAVECTFNMCSNDENDDSNNDIIQQEKESKAVRQTRESIERNTRANPYHVLQVRRDATPVEIRQSYRRLALWHHPGRTHESREERQRRLQVFEVLAACYETLMNPDSRRRFDAHIRSMEKAKMTSGLPSGAMFVGGKRLFGPTPSENDIISPIPTSWTLKEDSQIPGLSRSSSSASSSSDSSSEDGEASERMMILSLSTPGGASVRSDGRSLLNPLVDMSTSGSGSEEEIPEKHYTEDDTNRLFGGPLSDLYRARNFQPFTDSFTVFEEVFGSRIFNVTAKDIGRLQKWTPLRSTPAAGWEGTREISSDKKTCVIKTSRLLHNRRLTRTETVTINPLTGKRYSVVTVTGEDIPEKATLPDMSDASCLMCFNSMQVPNRSGPVCENPVCKKDESDALWCDIDDLWNTFVEELGIPRIRYDLFTDWTNAFGCSSFWLV